MKRILFTLSLMVTIFLLQPTLVLAHAGHDHSVEELATEIEATPSTFEHLDLAPPVTYEALITKIKESVELEISGKKQLYQKLELKITKGDRKDQMIEVENGNIPMVNQLIYKVGDKVLVQGQQNFDGKEVFFISDYIRRTQLYILAGLFVSVTLVVGRLVGLKAILSMIFSFFIIFKFMLPQLITGQNPVWIVSITSLIIVPVTFYLTHGLNRKTTVAVISTYLVLVFSAFLGQLFIDLAHISGYASEEAGFLQAFKGGSLDISGLLLAGLIIGAVGILDDITISQASIVEVLKKTSPNLSIREIYTKGMNVGQAHIASMVNTLVLVYAGAALPLLLLFVNNPHPFSEVINYEIVAEEIIRTLIGSIGLILAVPLTTLLAAFVMNKQQK